MRGEQYFNHIAALDSDAQQELGEKLLEIHKKQMKEDKKTHMAIFIVLFVAVTLGAALQHFGII